ncbi:hypothetical protein CEXT_287321 [Caerostris extrusa]|uniref:Uncharacterized protein n=1 Tax=Caerostris extrusa TaxID=172846 RepID=A0AAV4M4W5_CAEEX|nr:hypothetical protein CEXT_287321 [Caerostris extrusa]
MSEGLAGQDRLLMLLESPEVALGSQINRSQSLRHFGGTQSQNRVLVHDYPSVNPGVFRSEVKRTFLSVRLF